MTHVQHSYIIVHPHTLGSVHTPILFEMVTTLTVHIDRDTHKLGV